MYIRYTMNIYLILISQINVNNKLQVFGELAKHSFAQRRVDDAG